MSRPAGQEAVGCWRGARVTRRCRRAAGRRPSGRAPV